MAENLIDMLSVADLYTKKFFIPDFQRGYRWESQQVSDLLSDIWEFAQKEQDGFYCLQPIVVKKCSQEVIAANNLPMQNKSDEWYEVIDGQQRLTTIRIMLYFYYHYAFNDDADYKNTLFEIRYQTRPESTAFLSKGISDGICTKNIDLYHMSKAYETMIKWFSGEGQKEFEKRPKKRDSHFWDVVYGDKKAKKSIQVIWYEIVEGTKSEDLFERLNKGKIPLTNAELIKAMFLKSSSFVNSSENELISYQSEIAKQWDIMEHRLNDKKFWAFITNKKMDSYATKIEFLLEQIPLPCENPDDRLATYLKFNAEYSRNPSGLWELWGKIENCYLALNHWYEDKNLYHKIGFLLACGVKVSDLVNLMQSSTKKAFVDGLDKEIGKQLPDKISTLRYTSTGDKNKLQTLLFFYNVETSRKSNNPYDFFPFIQYKEKSWTLEHIHAQQSEDFNQNDSAAWKSWLEEHEKVLSDLSENYEQNDEIKKRIEQIVLEIKSYLPPEEKTLNFSLFKSIVDNVLALCGMILSDNGELPATAELHDLSNMALLGGIENTKLTNSIFEVKRRAIIEMDKNGDFIPICTRRVFLKYYFSPSESEQTYNAGNSDFIRRKPLHYFFWGSNDRKSYLKDMKNVLAPYLPENETF